jgi:hypothetical protein
MLKWNVKCHYTKQDDSVFVINKECNNSSFLFSTNKFVMFLISRMSVEESIVEKLQRQLREKL